VLSPDGMQWYKLWVLFLFKEGKYAENVLQDVNLVFEYLNLFISEKRRKVLKKGTVLKLIQTWNPFSSHHTEKRNYFKLYFNNFFIK
jgi:hypothetical protein